MDFESFLSNAQKKQFWERHKKIIFTASSYPIAWFSMLFQVLENKNVLPATYQRIFTDTADKKILYATLTQSILGTYSFFWLGDITESKESKQALDFINFLLSYKGPHFIAFFINNTSKVVSIKEDNVIPLPPELSKQQCQAIADSFGSLLDEKKLLWIKKTIAKQPGVTLDTYCMFLQYLELINTKYLTEYSAWLESLIGVSTSLSQLSEYFFSKNASAFFTHWSVLNREYPDVFWTVFWSEQLWKAYHVIMYLKKNDFVLAKRMSYRLPYSFINKDWHKITLTELAAGYDFLYHIDYSIKTGSTFCALDLFYMNHFTGGFTRKGNAL